MDIGVDIDLPAGSPVSLQDKYNNLYINIRTTTRVEPLYNKWESEGCGCHNDPGYNSISIGPGISRYPCIGL